MSVQGEAWSENKERKSRELGSEMREPYERRGLHWEAPPMVVMWDLVARNSDGDSAKVRQRKIKGKTKREKVCFFLKFGQTEDKRIEKGKAKVNHADREGVLCEVSNL